MAENIKDLFIQLAKYNRITNQELIALLKGIEHSKLTEDMGSYYGSILGLLNHQLLADINWLRAYGDNISSLEFIKPILNRFPIHRKPPKELHWASIKEYKVIREEIDELLERVVDNISLAQYVSTLKMENRRGTVEFITWRYLLHLFNHHTHHRGGISILLDQLNIENDYSNLLWKE